MSPRPRLPSSFPLSAVLVLLGATLVALGPAVLSSARTFYDRDISMFWLPRTEVFVRTIAEGAWPVRDPSVAFGMPMLADPTFQVAYPFTWLNLLVPPSAAYEAFALFHAVFAGLGACLLVRERVGDRRAALVAGGLFATCGPFVSLLGMAPHYAGASWLPWVSWLALRLADRPAATRAAALAAAFALQVFAGSAEMCAVSLVACTIVLATAVARRERAPRWDLLRGFAVAAVLGAGLSAIQWLPTLAILGAGSRLVLDRASLATWSLHPMSLLDLFVPQLVANLVLSTAARADLFDGREPFLASLYLGSPALVWGLLGIERRSRMSWVAAAAFLACVAVALGRHSPAWSALATLPPFSMFRYPVKYMVPASLCWAVLVGLGFARWARASARTEGPALARAAAASAVLALLLAAAAIHPPGAVRGLLAEGGDIAMSAVLRSALAMLATAGLVLWQSRRAAVPSRHLCTIAAAIVLGDAALQARPVNRVGPVDLLVHVAPAAHRVATEGGGRVYSVPHTYADLRAQMARGPVGWAPQERWILGFVERLSPLSPGRYGLLGSFDGDVAGIAPPILSRATLLVGAVRKAALPLLRLGGVRWVVGLERWPELRLVAELPSVYASPILLQEVPDPLPATYVVGGARGEPVEAALVLLAGGADPRREVLLDAGVAGGVSGGSGWSRVLDRRADRLSVEAEASAPAWLVVNEGYAPAWRARVDGEETVVRRANLLFQAVPLPAGRHRVELRYVPPGLVPGLVSTGAAGLVLAFILGRALKMRGRSATILASRGNN